MAQHVCGTCFFKEKGEAATTAVNGFALNPKIQDQHCWVVLGLPAAAARWLNHLPGTAQWACSADPAALRSGGCHQVMSSCLVFHGLQFGTTFDSASSASQNVF